MEINLISMKFEFKNSIFHAWKLILQFCAQTDVYFDSVSAYYRYQRAQFDPNFSEFDPSINWFHRKTNHPLNDIGQVLRRYKAYKWPVN